jgi:hypothetical protein
MSQLARYRDAMEMDVIGSTGGREAGLMMV